MVGLKRLIELALPWRRGIMAVVDEARELLTVSEVAERCHVSRQTVYNWVRAGHLRPAVKYREGTGWVPLFDPADIVGMRDRRRKTAS
jgi:excisionase family DNA binding protein